LNIITPPRVDDANTIRCPTNSFLLKLNLGLEVASFAAVDAVILAVLAKTDVILTHAESAIALTLAFIFRLVAQHTDECLGHGTGSPESMLVMRSS
jgi:hypothetical protein